MNILIYTIICLALGVAAGHVYTIEQAKQGEYHWCKK